MITAIRFITKALGRHEDMSVSRFWVCTTCSESVRVSIQPVQDHPEPQHLAQCPICHWERHLFLAAWARQVIAFPDRGADAWASQEQSQTAELVPRPTGNRRRCARKKTR